LIGSHAADLNRIGDKPVQRLNDLEKLLNSEKPGRNATSVRSSFLSSTYFPAGATLLYSVKFYLADIAV
jgi:hypothetical protein